jgi:mannose-6-phosphate isomerase-like protein (cupin superfamily)
MSESGSSDSIHSGDGYAVAHLEDLGDGPGFRKIRGSLGVQAFGANALVLPSGMSTGWHYHDVQEELYFVHQGQIRMTFGNGDEQDLAPGGLARVDATTQRMITNIGDGDAIYVIVGGSGGYVGRDGHVPEGKDGPGHGA